VADDRLDLLFVYGTLRATAGHPMHAVLAAAATAEGTATVRGRLHDLGEYPGLVLDPAGDRVTGELYRIHDPAVWATLDAYEGCGPDDPLPHEFSATETMALTADGSVPCTIYVYNSVS
jgi:gamma-glutamylcyclotransferase (GGCT)/AIG2-like uncharacterized protein YtfP